MALHAAAPWELQRTEAVRWGAPLGNRRLSPHPLNHPLDDGSPAVTQALCVLGVKVLGLCTLLKAELLPAAPPPRLTRRGPRLVPTLGQGCWPLLLLLIWSPRDLELQVPLLLSMHLRCWGGPQALCVLGKCSALSCTPSPTCC